MTTKTNGLYSRTVAVAVGLLLPMLQSCSSMQIRAAADPQADLTRYKTYAWAPQPAESEGKPQSTILDQTVKDSVARELAAKNLRPAEGAPPDLLVSYYGVSKTLVTYGAVSGAPYGTYQGYIDPYFDQAYVTRQGSLTLQFIDAKTNRIVWQGTAADTISDAGASQEQVAKAVNKLVEKYPAA